tara:strand:- start:1375 stop:2235 length:861 start_codon:yes stop_codon:yes gene_type:complete
LQAILKKSIFLIKNFSIKSKLLEIKKYNMYENINLFGFNLRSEDYLIKILIESFKSINILCVENFEINDKNQKISLKINNNNHPLINGNNTKDGFFEIDSIQNPNSLSIINLPSSFSDNYSKLVDLNFPKIFNFEDHKIFETYFFNKKDLSSQIITMPISEKDLITRINICFYQSNVLNENIKEEKVITQGLLQIDTEKYLVTLEGKKIDLTFKELELLKVLSSNPGRVFSRENLLKNIWDYDYYGGTRTVDVHVRRLRRKIEDHKYNFIETIWNVGYKFNELEIG